MGDTSPGGMGGYPPRESCDPLGEQGLVELFLLSSEFDRMGVSEVMASDPKRRMIEWAVARRCIEVEQDPNDEEEVWVKEDNGRWRKECQIRGKKPPATRHEASYWDLLPPEVRRHVLEARDREEEKDREKARRERWKPIHEELSRLPCCSQHGTVRPCYFRWVEIEANLIDSFIFFDVF